jgi:transposase-like protein
MMQGELSEELGYEKYEARGRNSGNSRNGKRPKQLRTPTGDVTIQVPRDRNGDFQSPLLGEQHMSNQLEEKIIGLYAKGISTRDIQVCDSQTSFQSVKCWHGQ